MVSPCNMYFTGVLCAIFRQFADNYDITCTLQATYNLYIDLSIYLNQLIIFDIYQKVNTIMSLYLWLQGKHSLGNRQRVKTRLSSHNAVSYIETSSIAILHYNI